MSSVFLAKSGTVLSLLATLFKRAFYIDILVHNRNSRVSNCIKLFQEKHIFHICSFPCIESTPPPAFVSYRNDKNIASIFSTWSVLKWLTLISSQPFTIYQNIKLISLQVLYWSCLYPAFQFFFFFFFFFFFSHLKYPSIFVTHSVFNPPTSSLFQFFAAVKHVMHIPQQIVYQNYPSNSSGFPHLKNILA